MSQHSARHLYVTWRWNARTSSPWVGETAVCGFRIGITPSASSQPGYSDGTVGLTPFLINDASVNTTTAHLTKVQNWAGDSGGTTDITDGDQDGIAEAVYAFNNALVSRIPNDYTFGDIRLYAIGDNGKMAGNAPVLYTITGGLDGGATGNWLPQNSVVLTLGTAAAGRKGRGRFYFGPVKSDMYGADALLVGSENGVVGGAAQTMLQAVRNIGSIASTRYFPIVWHRGTTTGAVVRTIRVGDEIDTQQRRRHGRKETYTAYDLS